MASLNLCRKLAESDVTVTPFTFMDFAGDVIGWLHNFLFYSTGFSDQH